MLTCCGTCAGVDVMWASFFADYSSENRAKLFGNITTSYIFGLGGMEQQMIFLSAYETTSSLTMDLWSYVLESVSITSA